VDNRRRVFENENSGSDQVQASINYGLATNVENLTLTGGAVINGTGNTLANVLIVTALPIRSMAVPEPTR